MPPATIMTESMLSMIRRHPLLPRQTWYFIAGTTLATLNRPGEIPAVLDHALSHGERDSVMAPSPGEQLRIARRLREALIKAAVVHGLPKVRNHPGKICIWPNV